jgi:hypothetical protein
LRVNGNRNVRGSQSPDCVAEAGGFEPLHLHSKVVGCVPCWQKSRVTNERRQMRALRDSECSGSDSQMQRFESRHLANSDSEKQRFESSRSNSQKMERFESCRPSQAVRSLRAMSGLQKYARHSRELARRCAVFEAAACYHRLLGECRRVMQRAWNGGAAAPAVGSRIVDLEFPLAAEPADHVDFPTHLGHRHVSADRGHWVPVVQLPILWAKATAANRTQTFPAGSMAGSAGRHCRFFIAPAKSTL